MVCSHPRLHCTICPLLRTLNAATPQQWSLWVGGWVVRCLQSQNWSVAVVKPGTSRCHLNVSITGLFHLGIRGQWLWASGFTSSSECSSSPVFLFLTVWVRGWLLWHRETFMFMHCLDFLSVVWPLSKTLLNCCSKITKCRYDCVCTPVLIWPLYWLPFICPGQIKPWTSSLWHLLKNLCVLFKKDKYKLSLAPFI